MIKVSELFGNHAATRMKPKCSQHNMVATHWAQRPHEHKAQANHGLSNSFLSQDIEPGFRSLLITYMVFGASIYPLTTVVLPTRPQSSLEPAASPRCPATGGDLGIMLKATGNRAAVEPLL